MLSVLALLLFQGNFFSLRMNSGGSFPRPLKPEEEQVLLEQAGAGDMAARNKLIEHNLRLVAHIVKNRESAMQIHQAAPAYWPGRPASLLMLRRGCCRILQQPLIRRQTGSAA